MISLLLALSMGCGDEEPTDDSTVESDTDTDADTDSDTDTDVQLTGVEGVVANGDGVAVAGARVNMCQGNCWYTTTDATGAFSFEDELPAQTYAFDVVVTSGEYTTPLTPLTLAEGDRPNVSVTVLKPTTTVDMPATTGTVEVEGITLEIDVDTLTFPFGIDSSKVRGVLVQPQDRLPFEGIDGEIVAVWYLDPFDTVADPGIPFRIENSFGLEEGATVHAWAADYLHANWADAGTLTVTDGVLVNDGTGLPVISTLVLVKE